MKPIRLVICDIDNTLVPKHHNVSARTHTCISQLKKKALDLATSLRRSIDQLHILEEMWNIQCEILIGLNGSEIYDGIAGTTETLYSMEPEWIRQCLEIMAPFPCNPTLGRNGVAYVRSLDQNVSSSAAFVKTKFFRMVKDDSNSGSSPRPRLAFGCGRKTWKPLKSGLRNIRCRGLSALKRRTPCLSSAMLRLPKERCC